MANTMTALLPTLFSAARIVPRELTGVIAAGRMDFNDKSAALGDTVKVPVSPIQAVTTITPAQTFTAGSNRTPTSIDLLLDQTAESSWNMTGEEEQSLMNGGNALDVFQQTVAQACRAVVNTIETHAWTVARAAASRAVGSAGTTPFASTIALLPQARQILDDNGATPLDRSFVCNTNAGVNLRNIANLFKVNEAGDASLLRSGILGTLYNLDIRESAAPVSKTAGTGASYVSDGAQSVGATSILVKTGTGTVLAGDVVTFTGDANKYVVKTGIAGVGTVVLQEPGLKQSLADAVAMTVGSAATANIVMAKSSLVTVVRPYAQPAGGGIESAVITDPQTGLSFGIVRAVGSGMASWYVRCVYKAFAPNPYGIAQLLG